VGNINSRGCAVRVDYEKKWTPEAKTDRSIMVTRLLDANGKERFEISGDKGFVYCKKLPFKIFPESGEVEVKNVQYDEFVVNYTLDGHSGLVSAKISDGQFPIQAGNSYFVTDNGKTYKVFADSNKTLNFDIEMAGQPRDILIMSHL
jgi:hypothetical protein